MVLGCAQSFADRYPDEAFSQEINVYRAAHNQYLLSFNQMDIDHFLFAIKHFNYPSSKDGFEAITGYIASQQSAAMAAENQHQAKDRQLSSNDSGFKVGFPALYAEPEVDLSVLELVQAVSTSLN